MKKILVFSDCHYDKDAVSQLMNKIDEYDYVYFLGDGLDNITLYSYAYPNKIDAVRGNCDYYCFGNIPYEITNTVEGVTVFLTHGHLYGTKKSLDELEVQAYKHNASLVLYGHTHCQEKFEKDGVIYLNPGALCASPYPQYAEITVNEKNIQIYLRKLH